MNILLVEDDKDSVESCKEFAKLDDRDINIVVSNSLDEAKLCLNKNIDTAIATRQDEAHRRRFRIPYRLPCACRYRQKF